MKASSPSQETDASSLSEQKQPLTELRFRFRSSALKQSPSSDALIHDGEEEDFLEDQLARYVEPPELPTLAMHKVFGTFLLFTLKRFITCEMCDQRVFFIERDDDDQSSISSSNGSLLENMIEYADNETLFSITTTFITCICTHVIIIVNNRRFVLGDDVLLLVQSHRVLFRTSGDIFHVLGIAGVRSKNGAKRRERDGD